MQYKPLGTGDFRLLDLEAELGQLRARLENFSIRNPPHYVALSYHWGNSTIRYLIKIDGFDATITSNLNDALCHLRKLRIKWLWIDALCINQADPDERGSQILHMREIYNKADKVIAWLGTEVENCDQATKLLHTLSIAKSSNNRQSLEYVKAMRWLQTLQEDRVQDACWIALIEIIGRQYWSRAWIIQEIAVAKDVDLYCGSRSITWQSLFNSITEIYETAELYAGNRRLPFMPKLNQINTSGAATIIRAGALREAMATDKGKDQRMSLVGVLLRTSQTCSTDPRDKIYAFLGLALDGHALVPAPSYHETVSQVYTSVTTSMILARNDLNVICLKGKVDDLNLPSWVPNWGHELNLGIICNTWGEDVYNSTGTANFRYKGVVDFLDDCRILKARGVVFDKVDGLGGAVMTESAVAGNTTQPSMNNNPYIPEEKVYEAMWKSLVFDDKSYKGTSLVDFCYLPLLFEKAAREELLDDFKDILGDWCSGNETIRYIGKSLREWWSQWYRFVNPKCPDEVETLTDLELKFLNDFQFATLHKRLVVTEKGYIGMVPHNTQKGDLICLILGCSVPVVITDCDDGLRLVGESYIHGIMNGEGVDPPDESKLADLFIH